MKKKVWLGLGVVVLALGVGTAVYAAEDGQSTFQEMLPFMKQMHPQWSDEQLENMYQSCHQNGETGATNTNMMQSRSIVN
jgi:hypothetical protein